MPNPTNSSDNREPMKVYRFTPFDMRMRLEGDAGIPITINSVRAEKVGEEDELADGFHRGIVVLALPICEAAAVDMLATWFEEIGTFRIIVSLTYQVKVSTGLWEEQEVLLKRVVEVEEEPPRGERERNDKGYYSDDVSPMTRSPVSM